MKATKQNTAMRKISYTITMIAIVGLLLPVSAFADGYTISGEISFTKSGPIRLELVTEEEFNSGDDHDHDRDHGSRDHEEPTEEFSAVDSNRRLVIEVDTQAQKTKKVTYTFTDIPPGVYAIQAYQDVNENGQFDMGVFGPKEPYGFSNSVRPRFSHPKFDDAKFEVQGDAADMSFEIK